MKKYQCVVFDWDGTLMDSIEKIVECLQAAALDVGLPIPSVSKAKNIIGLSLQDAMLAIFGDVSELLLLQNQLLYFFLLYRLACPFDNILNKSNYKSRL